MFFDSLVKEEQPRFEINNCFALDIEAEMTRFDDSGMDRTDRDLICAFALNLLEGKRRSTVFEFVGCHCVLEQGMVIRRPELVQRKAAKIRVIGRNQTEQVVNFAFKEACQIP